VELYDDSEVNITMTSTVPPGLCNDLTFDYDHADSRVPKSDCQALFYDHHERDERGKRLEHTLKLSVQPAPGCNSYTSLMEFKPYDKPGQSMWTGYVPSNITVRLQSECLKNLLSIFLGYVPLQRYTHYTKLDARQSLI